MYLNRWNEYFGSFGRQAQRATRLNISVSLTGMLVGVVLVAGCQALRFAPSETQKKNAYLHHRTVAAAAIKAHNEETSTTLRKLTSQAAQQSDAIMAYYGLPQKIPASESVEDILSPANEEITAAAHAHALQRPNPWDLADSLLELGIALAGVVGGVYGTKAVTALAQAKQKSTALREIIMGNELFKRQYPESSSAFKQSHQQQSDTTRSLVASMK